MANPAGATPYFEAEDVQHNRLDEFIARGWGRLGPRLLAPVQFRRLGQIADDAEAQGRTLRDLSDRQLLERAQALRARLLREGIAPFARASPQDRMWSSDPAYPQPAFRRLRRV